MKVTTRIIKEVNKRHLKELIKKREDNIHVSKHAFFHITKSQRQIYNKEALIKTLLKEKINLAGLQKNGKYAIFYKRKATYIKLIIEIKDNRINIITFLNVKNIPSLRELRK